MRKFLALPGLLSFCFRPHPCTPSIPRFGLAFAFLLVRICLSRRPQQLLGPLQYYLPPPRSRSSSHPSSPELGSTRAQPRLQDIIFFLARARGPMIVVWLLLGFELQRWCCIASTNLDELAWVLRLRRRSQASVCACLAIQARFPTFLVTIASVPLLHSRGAPWRP